MLHNMKRLQLLCCWLLVFCTLELVIVEADYTFSIQLLSFSNPNNTLANGSCCNSLEEEGSCSSPCSTTLIFCIRDANHSLDDLECSTRLFSGSADPRGLNPSVDGPWPGAVQLFIRADSLEDNRPIDNIFIELRLVANDELTPLQSYNGEFGVVRIELAFQVICAINFFGTDCNTLCIGRDDPLGHQMCTENGTLVCIEGYRNESTNCTECIPSEGCSPVNGFCTFPGECLCLEGFFGDNCTEGPSSPGPAVSQTQTVASSDSISAFTSPQSTLSNFDLPSVTPTRMPGSNPAPTSSAFIPISEVSASSLARDTRSSSPSASPVPSLPPPGASAPDDGISNDLVPLIVGTVISGVVLIILMITITTFALAQIGKKRRKRGQKKEYMYPDPYMDYNMYGIDSAEFEFSDRSGNHHLSKSPGTETGSINGGIEVSIGVQQDSEAKRNTLPDATVTTFQNHSATNESEELEEDESDKESLLSEVLHAITIFNVDSLLAASNDSHPSVDGTAVDGTH